MARTYKGQKRNLHEHIDIAFRQDTINKFAAKVEEAHGWIHGVIGGGWEGGQTYRGHMWPLEYSAFEPIFMLHHTYVGSAKRRLTLLIPRCRNVDRLFAMYQAAHPDKYFESEKIGGTSTVFLADNSQVDSDTNLVPFKRSSGGFWTPNSVRNTTTFGYAYPETIKSNSNSEDEHVAAVKANITTLYGSNARGLMRLQQTTSGGYAVFAEENKFTDWTIATKALPRSPSSFVARFSLSSGKSSSDPTTDVGSWVKLTHAGHGSDTIDKVYEGSISLTVALLDQEANGKLASLNAEDVVPFLKQNLSWKVLTVSTRYLITTCLSILKPIRSMALCSQKHNSVLSHLKWLAPKPAFLATQA